MSTRKVYGELKDYNSSKIVHTFLAKYSAETFFMEVLINNGLVDISNLCLSKKKMSVLKLGQNVSS